jgi:hypothetical protein
MHAKREPGADTPSSEVSEASQPTEDPLSVPTPGLPGLAAMVDLMRETAKPLTDKPLRPLPGEDEWARAIVSGGRTWYQRLWRAMMLAPTIEVCEALMAGEAVPLERLDQEWVKRFGLRG